MLLGVWDLDDFFDLLDAPGGWVFIEDFLNNPQRFQLSAPGMQGVYRASKRNSAFANFGYPSGCGVLIGLAAVGRFVSTLYASFGYGRLISDVYPPSHKQGPPLKNST